MTTFLHLLKGDSADLARPVIEEHGRQPGSRVTVVLLEAATPPTLPPTVRVRRLAEDDLDYSALLDLIFESDHVITW